MTPKSLQDADRVCPQPRAWSQIYKALYAAWESSGRIGEPPPTPIILSGWLNTPAVVKWIAWQLTEQWAAERQLSDLIPELAPNDWASVSDASGIETHEHQYHEPSSVPSKQLLADSLDRLNRAWRLVAEPIADQTSPVAFTGRKGRRLLVEADFGILPPWGSWTELVDRKAFTIFRRKVNEAITPHRVDHIDFRRQRTKTTN